MSTMNALYAGPQDCPSVIPVFPLPGALLLPRGQMPLNIFEPRYVTMIDDAFRADRIVGIIQPRTDEAKAGAAPPLWSVGCAGRLTQLAETGDGRYLVSLVGVARFRVVEEMATTTPYRQCRVDYEPFAGDFIAHAGEEETDREGVLRALRAFAQATDMKLDWSGVEEAPTEALVNALCMMSPYGLREKQALLEAPDLKTRAEVLIAVTEMALARDGDGSQPTLQ